MPDDKLKSPQQSRKRSKPALNRKKKLQKPKSQKLLDTEGLAPIIGVRTVSRGSGSDRVIQVGRQTIQVVRKGRAGPVIERGIIRTRPGSTLDLRERYDSGKSEYDSGKSDTFFQDVPGGVPVDNEEIEQRKVVKRALAEIALAHKQMGVDHKEIEELKTETRVALDQIRAALNR